MGHTPNFESLQLRQFLSKFTNRDTFYGKKLIKNLWSKSEGHWQTFHFFEILGGAGTPKFEQSKINLDDTHVSHLAFIQNWMSNFCLFQKKNY